MKTLLSLVARLRSALVAAIRQFLGIAACGQCGVIVSLNSPKTLVATTKAGNVYPVCHFCTQREAAKLKGQRRKP